MQHTWRADLQSLHNHRKASNLWRERLSLETGQATTVSVSGQALRNFCSNDYLGLASDPRVRGAAAEAAQQWGAGSGASHLVCGHLELHATLEHEIAEFVGAESALLFSNGYMANLGVCAALASKHVTVVQDKLNHASLIDGARLSLGPSHRYRHLSVAHADSILCRSNAERHLLLTDGVFSMDGDVAPLAELSRLADDYNGLLLVDDAHGLGVLGEQGRGALNAAGLAPCGNILMMGTLGKAIGSFGAFVAGDALLIEYLLQTARTYMYTTALPPAAVAASLAGLNLIKEEGSPLQAALIRNIDYFRSRAVAAGLEIQSSATAIQPMLIGDPQRALEVSRVLRADGIWVGAVRPPTVPVGTSRLRITLSAKHKLAELDALIESLSRAMRSVQ